MPTALITGASSGIGAAFSDALARRGFDLVLVARREERLKAVAEQSLALGAGRVEIVVCDLSHSGAPVELQARVAAVNLKIDFLINNAGFGTTGRFHQMPLERELEQIKLNVLALVSDSSCLKCLRSVAVPLSTSPRLLPSSQSRTCRPMRRPRRSC